MSQLIYIMHFRGQASRSGDKEAVIRSTSSAASCTIQSVIRRDGLQTSLSPLDGDLAFLESEVRLTGPESFEGQGTIVFGDESEHALRFSTLSPGHLGSTAIPETLAGTVSWRIDGGSGQFAAATGFITSTFTLTDSGDLSDYHCGLIFLPD